MKGRKLRPRTSFSLRLGAAAITALFVLPNDAARADEGGVSFWIPGFFGSLAAAPSQASGWSVTSMYYHTSVSAGADVVRAREITIGRIPANQCECESWPCGRDLHLCDTGTGWTGLCELAGCLRLQLNVARGIAGRDIDWARRRSIPILALR